MVIKLTFEVIRMKDKIYPRLLVDMNKYLEKNWKEHLNRGNVLLTPEDNKIMITIRNDEKLIKDFKNDMESKRTKAVFKGIKPFVKTTLIEE